MNEKEEETQRFNQICKKETQLSVKRKTQLSMNEEAEKTQGFNQIFNSAQLYRQVTWQITW